MAVLEPAIDSIHIIATDPEFNSELLQITFELSGVYADADGIQLTDVPAAIDTHRKAFGVGKEAVLIDAMRSHWPATKNGTATSMSLTSVTVSGDNITAKVTDGDESTPLADGSVPVQGRPFSVLAVVRIVAT